MKLQIYHHWKYWHSLLRQSTIYLNRKKLNCSTVCRILYCILMFLFPRKYSIYVDRRTYFTSFSKNSNLSTFPTEKSIQTTQIIRITIFLFIYKIFPMQMKLSEWCGLQCILFNAIYNCNLQFIFANKMDKIS